MSPRYCSNSFESENRGFLNFQQVIFLALFEFIKLTTSMSCDSFSPILTVSRSELLPTGRMSLLQLLSRSSYSRLASALPCTETYRMANCPTMTVANNEQMSFMTKINKKQYVHVDYQSTFVFAKLLYYRKLYSIINYTVLVFF